MDVRLADAARLPFPDHAAELVVAFRSLHDMDDMVGAMREAFRVVGPSSRFCLAVVHPLNSAGRFSSEAPDAPFTIAGDYFEPHLYADAIEQEGCP